MEVALLTALIPMIPSLAADGIASVHWLVDRVAGTTRDDPAKLAAATANLAAAQAAANAADAQRPDANPPKA